MGSNNEIQRSDMEELKKRQSPKNRDLHDMFADDLHHGYGGFATLQVSWRLAPALAAEQAPSLYPMRL